MECQLLDDFLFLLPPLSPRSSFLATTIAVPTSKGMSLMEDKGLIFVKKIDSTSVLGRDGRIRAGDRILSINGKSLDGLAINKVRSVPFVSVA